MSSLEYASFHKSFFGDAKLFLKQHLLIVGPNGTPDFSFSDGCLLNIKLYFQVVGNHRYSGY